jgi:Domain of unknown function (DUF4282)
MPERNFLSSLFDISFTSFITTRIIKVVYVITLVLIGLAALVFVVAAFAESPAGGIFVLLIVAPLVSLLYVIYARVLLELVMAIFRIMEHTGEQVNLLRAQSGGVAGAPTTPIPTPPSSSSSSPPAGESPYSPPQPPGEPPSSPPPGPPGT